MRLKNFVTLFLLVFISYLVFAIPPPVVTVTTKGQPMLTYDGYQYRQKGRSTDGTTQFWTCMKQRICEERLHTNIETGEVTKYPGTHRAHGRSQTDITVRERHEEIKRLAAIPVPHGDAPPRLIHHTVTEGLNDEELEAMPSENAVRLTVQRTRKKPETANVDKPNVDDIIIQGFYETDYAQNRFLLHDSKDTEPDASRFFIFATDDGLERLRNNRQWASDGTFYIKPQNFMQVYVLAAMIDGSAVPCAYAMLQRKDLATYRRLFAALNEYVGGAGPERMITDFEEAVTIAAHEIWPHVQTSLCLFHLSQSVMRRVQNAGLSNYYHSEEGHNFRLDIRRVAALSALPTNLVERGFNVLLNRAHARARPIIRNFGRTYIRAANGNLPRFRIETWNSHNAITQHLSRNNNAVESNNLVLKSHFKKKSPKFSKLITVFKFEEKIWQTRYRLYRLNGMTSSLVQRRHRLRTTKERNLKMIVDDFDSIREPTDDDIFGFLTHVNFWLRKKGIENWVDWPEDEEVEPDNDDGAAYDNQMTDEESHEDGENGQDEQQNQRQNRPDNDNERDDRRGNNNERDDRRYHGERDRYGRRRHHNYRERDDRRYHDETDRYDDRRRHHNSREREDRGRYHDDRERDDRRYHNDGGRRHHSSRGNNEQLRYGSRSQNTYQNERGSSNRNGGGSRSQP